MKHILEFSIYESLKTAKVYATKNGIDQSVVEDLALGDPTPTKKYLEMMVKYVCEEKIGKDLVIEYIKNFDDLTRRNIIKTKDIVQFQTFQELQNAIDAVADIKTSTEKRREQKQMEAEWAKQNCKVILDDDHWFIVQPLDHEASVYFGRNSHWCTSLRGSDSYWKIHIHEQEGALYYCTDKTKPIYNYNGGNPTGDPLSLIAILALPRLTLQLWDGSDKELDYSYVNTMGVDLSLFKSLDQIIVQTLDDVEELFQRKGIEYTRHQNDVFDIDGSLSAATVRRLVRNLQLIVNFGTVTGDFLCSDIGIISLDGIPKEVGGEFDCSRNGLSSLSGCPDKVGSHFNCNINSLTDLEGYPKEVGGSFSCSSNNITSLKGLPKKIQGDFMCARNDLTSLEGGPEIVHGSYNCSYNKLINLIGCAKTIGDSLVCTNNELLTLEGGPDDIGYVISCGSNPLPNEEIDNYKHSHPKVYVESM